MYWRNIIKLISSKGVIEYEVYKKGEIDSKRMVDFINKLINGKYKNKLIILDNVSSHRNQLVKDVLDEIPIHIYKNLIKRTCDRSETYVKRPSTRKRKPEKY